MPGRQKGHCLETWNEFLPLQKQVMCFPASGRWCDDQAVTTPLGIVCLLLGKETHTKIYSWGKKTKTTHKYRCHEAEQTFCSHLAYKKLQATNQLSTRVYNKVKPLKKNVSSWSKRKGGNPSLWEGGKINFALSPEKGWERELVCNLCVACIENRN